MKTEFAQPATVRGDWYVIDASGKTLGRLASRIALRLKGKHKPDYSPHVDMGDHIVVLHADKIAVTGNKLDDKMYHHHTGHLGNLKSIALGTLLKEHPERAIQFAVKGMLRRPRWAERCTASCMYSRAASIRTWPNSPNLWTFEDEHRRYGSIHELRHRSTQKRHSTGPFAARQGPHHDQ